MVENEITRNTIVVGDGSVTVIPYQFVYNETDSNLEIVVKKKDTNVDPETVTTLVSTVDYEKYSDRIELTDPLAEGEFLLVKRVVINEQILDYNANRPFPAEVHEDVVDRAFMSLAELKESQDKVIRIQDDFFDDSIKLNPPVDGKALIMVEVSSGVWEIQYDDAFNPDDYYDKEATDLLLDAKADVIESGVSSIESQTGSVSLADLNLDNVDNTSDADKPVSTAQQTALDSKANSADLAQVATSGSYANLLNKPKILGDIYSIVIDPSDGIVNFSQFPDKAYIDNTFGTVTNIFLPSAAAGNWRYFECSDATGASIGGSDAPSSFDSELVYSIAANDRKIYAFRRNGDGWEQIGGAGSGGGAAEFFSVNETGDGSTDTYSLGAGNAVESKNQLDVTVGGIQLTPDGYDLNAAKDAVIFPYDIESGAKVYIRGIKSIPQELAGTGTSTIKTFTGDGSTTSFNTELNLQSTSQVLAFIGPNQQIGNISVSGTNVEFSEAPYDGAEIAVVIFGAVSVNVPAADSVGTDALQDRAVTPEKIPDVIKETKLLPNDITVNSTGSGADLASGDTINQLSYTNKMEIGGSYRLQVALFVVANSGVWAFGARQTGVPEEPLGINFLNERVDTNVFRGPLVDIEFVAQGTGIEFFLDIGGGGESEINGSNSLTETYVSLSKLPYNIVEGTL